jgi:hypothetical protein
MESLLNSRSGQLTLDEALDRLRTSPSVDGLALFGSQTGIVHPASDYDLLILVREMPEPIFQMFTTIDGRMADIVFVEAAWVDILLDFGQPAAASSFEGMFFQKMRTARIVYDASNRLKRAQRLVQAQPLLLPSDEGDLYSVWFWLNQGLSHMKRMIQVDAPAYQTAVDLMLMGALSSICRDYFRVRSLPWEGEKAAARYLTAHDPAFLELLRACIAQSERHGRLGLYEQLAWLALEPVGALWETGVTAVFLRDAPQSAVRLKRALSFWQDLFDPV